jgi:chemotaxis protein histidine kinase CheA/CheY-like chemotaxis protein
MTLHTDFHDESYRQFLSEAQDLLVSIEQDLLALRDDQTPARVHSLMRAAHTLKGAAASIDRRAIKQVAHVMEDIFSALYSPQAIIDDRVEGLLFQGYECLRLLLSAELRNSTVDEADVLNRAASIIADLQDILGDCFQEEAPVLHSSDLGFDLVQSMFETGVADRLANLEKLLHRGNPTLLLEALKTHADVFLGLAESLNLPGFGAIASTTLKALNTNPNQVISIAKAAFKDFSEGQTRILAGDRTQGGSPSSQLTALTQPGFTATSDSAIEDAAEPSSILLFDDEDLSTINLDGIDLGDFEVFELDDGKLELDHDPLELDDENPESNCDQLHEIENEREFDIDIAEIHSTHPSLTQGTQPSPYQITPSIRVDLTQLSQLEHLSGELLIQQTKHVAEGDELQLSIRQLQAQMKIHLATLQDLQDELETIHLSHRRDLQILLAIPQRDNSFGLDDLEMDDYSHRQALTQTAIDQAYQLTSMMTSMAQTAKRSAHTVRLQRRLLTNLQDDITTVRMQSVGTVLNRFPRVIEQLTNTYGKPVELVIDGADVLIDRIMVEKLYDPLLHIIRNAFDHGIESTSERQALDKPSVGRIEIRCFNQGGSTVIEISDDGRGINPEQIGQRAIALNLVTAEKLASLSHDEILDFLFHSGFSTAANVSDLSGRGVGLDVVRTQLHEMQGKVTIHSIPKHGTTFRLRLPFSLTVASLLLCEIEASVYAFPVGAGERVILAKPEQLYYSADQSLVLCLPTQRHPGTNLNIKSPVSRSNSYLKPATLSLSGNKKSDNSEPSQDEHVVRVYQISELLQYSQSNEKLKRITADSPIASPARATLNPTCDRFQPTPVLLVRTASGLRGILIDRVKEEQELVIRPLSSLIPTTPAIQGCCILGDNQLALVIDAVTLLQQVEYSSDETQPALIASPHQSSNPSALARQTPFHPSDDSPHASINVPALLIVDDSATVRYTLAATLTQAGYHVLQASDGLDAIAQLKRHPLPAAIICDIEMPRCNGFQFLTQTRRHPSFSKIPVVMLTSRQSEKHQQIALELGASAYITKPYDNHHLLNTMSRVIGDRPLLTAAF